MRSLESRLDRLESTLYPRSFVTIQVPHKCTEEDFEYAEQKRFQESPQKDCTIVFLTNYSPEFAQQFYKDKEAFYEA